MLGRVWTLLFGVGNLGPEFKKPGLFKVLILNLGQKEGWIGGSFWPGKEGEGYSLKGLILKRVPLGNWRN